MERLKDLEKSSAPEAVCLSAQVLVTVVVMINLRRHWNLFPIKQLSPLCTLIACLSFFVLNLISLIGRSIEQNGNYYNFNRTYVNSEQECAQCRIKNDDGILVLAIIYTGLRQLPLMLFALKTLRVSVCFLNFKKEQLPKWLKLLFNRETTIILVSVTYSVLIGVANYLAMILGEGLNPYSSEITFQFFCPKQSGVVDWLATTLRYFVLAVSYTLSIRTYKQLDFKRFIFLIFLLANAQVILRCAFVFANIDFKTYHQFYYHSLFLNLLGTLILYPYSNYNRYVQQPPGSAVLENFDAFINYAPGINILRFFAEHRDREEHTSKYIHCFDNFVTVRQLKMLATVDPQCLQKCLTNFVKILANEDSANQIPQALELREKTSRGEITLSQIKVVEKRLFQFCLQNLFKMWKKTESRLYLEKEFKKNLVINEKMSSLGIDIGS